MACSGRQPLEGEESLGAVVADFDPGGGGSEGVKTFFKAVTQAVLLLEAEKWVLTPRLERALSGFQHRFARRLTGGQPSRWGGGSWEYPLLEEAMVEAGFGGIGTYITRRQNMFAQYITTRPILDLYERSAQRPEARVSRRWLRIFSMIGRDQTSKWTISNARTLYS